MKPWLRHRMNVADHIDQQIAGRLRPLEGSVVGVQAAISRAIGQGHKPDRGGASNCRLRWRTRPRQSGIRQGWWCQSTRAGRGERTVWETMAQYNKWYEQRGEASETLEALMNSAQGMLEKVALASDQVDELLDSLGTARRELPALEAAAPAR